MHAEDVLEFEDLRSLLARYLRGALGRAELARLRPCSDAALIQSALDDTAEAMEYLRAAGHPQPAARGAAIRIRFDDLPDPAPAIARLRIEGATLDAPEILNLSRLLDLAGEARSVLLAARGRFPRLGRLASAIADLREVARELRGKILPDGTLADEASAALARLRRDIERQRHQIQESLERFLRARHEDGTLQEDFVTIRNDRFVVPVVTGRERRVDGVIHGASGSGHTLFVEPLETIHLNNELVRLREEESRETHRIFREFTARLRARAAEISATAEALGEIEFLFAKAEFAADFECTVPRLSGPNTGGKTVALKTAGLLALMAHAGLPVPAAEAEFPVFDEILADIGDHQSLQESLSSFSAHIMALRRMLETATPESLVLLDELGRATDPEEGGALGVAVLEAFQSRGAFTIASTHLMAMKVYGASAAGVRNAGMGFDEETLEPTYVLRLGAPGKSAGLDIAARLGLDARLIEAARSRMTTAERDAARLLEKLHGELDALERERAELAAREARLEQREKSFEQSLEKKYAAKMRELEQQAASRAEAFERQAEQTIGELSQKARARVAKAKREYRESVESLKPAAPAETPRLTLEVGARVRLKGIRQPATVRRIAGDLLEVDAGYLKMQVSVSDVEEVLPAGESSQRFVQFQQGPSFQGSYREINVIGQRAEAAIDQVDKMLDSAALAQVERVRIVHGHGMGILRKAIADLLKQNPHVEKFYAAPPEEGGTGATIVELK